MRLAAARNSAPATSSKISTAAARNSTARGGRAVCTLGKVGAKGCEIPQARSSRCEFRAPGKQCRSGPRERSVGMGLRGPHAGASTSGARGAAAPGPHQSWTAPASASGAAPTAVTSPPWKWSHNWCQTLREWIVCGFFPRKSRIQLAPGGLLRHYETTSRQVAAHRHAGIPWRAPTAAEAVARRAIRNRRRGGYNAAMDWLTAWGSDVRQGARALRTNPFLGLVAVASLALAIGANTAIFTAWSAVMQHRIAVRQPERLVSIYTKAPSIPGLGYIGVSHLDALDYARNPQTFSGTYEIRQAPVAMVY